MKGLKESTGTFLMLILGIGLGILSKWIDVLELSDAIWWHRMIDKLDLRNVLSLLPIWLIIALCIAVYSATALRASMNVFFFFIGMNFSYHIYTVVFARFNPVNYMMIWYGLTFASTILAFICWYAAKEGAISIMIDISIIAVMILCCFSIGMWYFDMNGIVDTVIFIIMIMVLYQTPKRSLMTLSAGVMLAFVVRIFI